MRAWDEGLDFRELVARGRGDRRPRRPRRRLRPERVHARTSTSSSSGCARSWHASRGARPCLRRVHLGERQGARDLRARRRAAAARRVRPDLDLRRDPARPRSPTRAACSPGLSAFWFARTRAHRARTTCSRSATTAARSSAAGSRCCPIECRRPRLPLRVGLEGLRRDRRGLRAHAARRACASPSACPSRSSRRRRRPRAGHDENITREPRRPSSCGAERFAEVERRRARALRASRAAHAEARGIILADTKFEFGLDADGALMLGDEALTPDSSRFWPADGYAPGRPAAVVRQAVRARLLRGARLGQDRPRARRCPTTSSRARAPATSRRSSADGDRVRRLPRRPEGGAREGDRACAAEGGHPRSAGRGGARARCARSASPSASARVGRLVDLELEADRRRTRRAPRSSACASELLANPLIEAFTIELEGEA